jgi:signal transduction histidine kinase
VETLSFTVDSKLLRELGERLVGRPHIALAELVKNSYDADAGEVIIRFTGDSIEVEDNGHGMTYDDFVKKWLRIGSIHKERQEFSPQLGRPLTGSKGVGRLSVQLLASKLEIRSIADQGPRSEVVVQVDWDRAVEAGDLTSAPVMVDRISPQTTFVDGAESGTKLILTDLQNAWTAREFEELARELWPLKSPFEDDARESAESFNVRLESPNSDIVSSFNEQMQAVLDLWIAKLEGELLPSDVEDIGTPIKVFRAALAGYVPQTDHDDDWDTARDFEQDLTPSNAPRRTLRLTLERVGGEPEIVDYALEPCHLDGLSFEIRVFNFQYRQPRGIRVGEARAYLRQFGGVHIYDAGFHLPYYGPDTDWLHIEIDHSHRLSRSRLLPDYLQRPDGMNDLPTNSRLFGVVHVNTAHERRATLARGGRANEALAIQVSRDRLTEGSPAYRDLVTLVRWALDYYAMNAVHKPKPEAKPKPTPRPEDRPTERLKALKDTVDRHKDDIPEEAFSEISKHIDDALHDNQEQEERYESYLGVLGALATAGMSALAYEHEVSKQFEFLQDIATDLERAAQQEDRVTMNPAETAARLRDWIQRAQSTHDLFSYLLRPENREMKGRLQAKRTVDQVLDQIKFLNPSIITDSTGIPPHLRLPKATYAEWCAILQNLFLNAYNAMRHTSPRHLDISGGAGPTASWLLIQDTGVGIDLDKALDFFEPFKRGLEADRSRNSLTLGGGGLGLTIVRMIADEIDCDIEFVPPDENHATAVRISWKE